MIVGQIVGGKFSELLLRVKSSFDLELGELLIAEVSPSQHILFEVTDLFYGSQLSAQHLELISGFSLENDQHTDFLEPELRNYTLAKIKNVLTITQGVPSAPKQVPPFFGMVRKLKESDVPFLSKHSMTFGLLRSGSEEFSVPVTLDATKVFTHHLLITGTTGKGKSVLMKNVLWHAATQSSLSLLVFDPHNEYYPSPGLIDYPDHSKVSCYSTNDALPGINTLRFHTSVLRPEHFDIVGFSSPQQQLLFTYYKRYGADWIVKLFTEETKDFHEASLAVVRRRMRLLLDVDNKLNFDGIFVTSGGENTLASLRQDVLAGKIIIIDTSSFSGKEELLLATLITSSLYTYYRKNKATPKPTLNIVLEEAPRVLGKDVLDQGGNVFSTIAREGRKFSMSLTAITQLPSLIPKDILANMNTKIILGMEMAAERNVIVEAAPFDLRDATKAIASLDKGEAILCSNFAKFAIPLHVPFFDKELPTLKKAVRTSSLSFHELKE
ncbi:MAG: ATP-binding protein [Candidatus Woesearchaeota archaeon]|nr:MAG: ATP-binding protein [Candidatus Woesearchaeota archaeon]